MANLIKLSEWTDMQGNKKVDVIPTEEIIPLSSLELVCVEPITLSSDQIKNNAHEEIALNIAKEYGLPYVRLSEYGFNSVSFVQSIGGENFTSHTYLAQFYRLKEQ